MLTVAEALAAVIETVQSGPVEQIPLEAALGQVLAQDVVSDIDSPPFDKALMDGYASTETTAGTMPSWGLAAM